MCASKSGDVDRSDISLILGLHRERANGISGIALGDFRLLVVEVVDQDKAVRLLALHIDRAAVECLLWHVYGGVIVCILQFFNSFHITCGEIERHAAVVLMLHESLAHAGAGAVDSEIVGAGSLVGKVARIIHLEVLGIHIGIALEIHLHGHLAVKRVGLDSGT